MDRLAFVAWLSEQAITSSHSHHLPDEAHQGLNLKSLLENSYVAWCGHAVPEGNDPAGIADWLSAVGGRSYFTWLEKALMALYGLDQPLTRDSWQAYDQAIIKAHQEKDWHLRLLRERCGFKAAFLDAYWHPGSDNGHPELFRPVYRVNSLFYGYNQTARDHNGNNIQVLKNQQISDIHAYTRFIQDLLATKKAAGCVAFKCALAYDRGLDFAPGDPAQAQKAMRENPEQADVLAFQNHVMDTLCQTAAQLNIPLQVHTGLGLMAKSNAMQLAPLIARFPGTRFILMHGSYPWTDDIPGLCHVFPNIWADLCWLPMISTTAAEQLLHQLMDVCNRDQVIWGCDAWTGEESYAARLAFFHVLGRVLPERVSQGLMREADAWLYAKLLLNDNAQRLISK